MRHATRPVWLAPDAPADVQPTPLLLRPITELAVTVAVAAKMGAAGIKTIADLDRWEAEGKDITTIKGVGDGTAARIREAREAWRNGQ